MNITNKSGQVFSIVNFFVIGMILFVGISVMGPIAQELKNAVCLNSTNDSTFKPLLDLSDKSPEGATNSFGGAGNNRFGGYDGKVTHNPFLDTIASTSIIKTDKSLLNPDCVELNSGLLFLINNFTPIFIIFTLLNVIIMWKFSWLSYDPCGEI